MYPIKISADISSKFFLLLFLAQRFLHGFKGAFPTYVGPAVPGLISFQPNPQPGNLQQTGVT